MHVKRSSQNNMNTHLTDILHSVHSDAGESWKRTMEHYYMISLSENTRLPATPVLESPPREKYTITILIGNSDDKLTQKEWSSFYNEVNVLTVIHTTTTHFAGASMPDKPWQNACWVVDVSKTHQHAILKEHLDGLRKKYRQDSIAWVEGETKFIE